MTRKILWWVTAILVFTLMIGLLADIFLYVNDSDSTISATIQDYLGGSTETYRAVMVGFTLGSLVVHLSKWGRDA